MTEQTSCPICDEERMELQEWCDRRLRDLWEDFHKKVAALAEAHARGEHDDRRDHCLVEEQGA